jgi:polyisoprenoid-binding protein YceI
MLLKGPRNASRRAARAVCQVRRPGEVPLPTRQPFDVSHAIAAGRVRRSMDALGARGLRRPRSTRARERRAGALAGFPAPATSPAGTLGPGPGAYNRAMPIATGNYKLGPDNATLRVKTGRHGAAAKAGHDLEIEVKSWEATLNVAEDPASSSVELSADPTSLHVLQGVGGLQALGDDDKADIRKTIDKDVLKKKEITFSSSSVAAEGDGLAVSGDLTMGGKSKPVTFTLADEGGSLVGSTTVSQSDWGIKPYSALFGALKVNDEVTVEVKGTLG